MAHGVCSWSKRLPAIVVLMGVLPTFATNADFMQTAPASIGNAAAGDDLSVARAYLAEQIYARAFVQPFGTAAEALLLQYEPARTAPFCPATEGLGSSALGPPQYVPGWRFSGTAGEAFLLEVLTYEAEPAEMLADELLATPDPCSLGTVQRMNVVIGDVTGVLHGSIGSVPIYGALVTLDGPSDNGMLPGRVTILLPLLALTDEEAELLHDTEVGLRDRAQIAWDLDLAAPPGDCAGGTPLTGPGDPDWCLAQLEACSNGCTTLQTACNEERTAAVNGVRFGCTMVCWVAGGAIGGPLGGLVGLECTLVCQLVNAYVNDRWEDHCLSLGDRCNRRCRNRFRMCLDGLMLFY